MSTGTSKDYEHIYLAKMMMVCGKVHNISMQAFHWSTAIKREWSKIQTLSFQESLSLYSLMFMNFGNDPQSTISSASVQNEFFMKNYMSHII